MATSSVARSNDAREHDEFCLNRDCKPTVAGPLVVLAPNTVRCDICGTYYKNKMGLSQHRRTAHPEVRNEARAGPSGGARKRRLRQGSFTEDEVNLMLELKRRFHGDRFVAKKMEGYLDRTAKQLRNKRALPSYQALREEYLRRNPPQEEPSDDPAGSSGDEEVAVQEEVVPQPALPGADGGDTQPALQATEPEIPTHRLHRITDKALAHKFPKKVIPDGSAEAIRLLRGAFQFASELNYDVPQAHIDHIYKEVTLHFVSSDCGDGRERRPHRVRGKGRSHRRYLCARTQDLYNKNPGEVAKYVRNNVDWLEGYSQPDSSDVEELYTQLWGIHPKVQLPEMGQAKGLITLKDALPSFTLREIGKRLAH
ncbi:hypothetical protein HHI36_023469 [Cryptolaemus montrouzieri]|uniref:C2H2-type domain-containing protein n=1 Tax=Cryptolaemus montrouzieri TaxID=559131 RepID=A0ABD2PGI6_9CUCU